MNKRKSNFELLRIIAMLLIIAYHLAAHMNYHPFYFEGVNQLSVALTSIILGSWGILGVDLFLILSAWFLVDKEFESKKIIYLVYQTFIYVFLFTLLECIYQILTNGVAVGLKYMLLMLVNEILQPFWSKDYWYISAYFFLYLMIPWLNKLIKELERKELKKILIVLFFIPLYSNFHVGSPVVINVANFAYVYLLIGYLKKWRLCEKEMIKNLLGCIITTGIIIVSLFMDWILPKTGVLGLIHDFIPYTVGNINRHSLIILLDAIFIFYCLKNMEIKTYKIINMLASCTFGIYLFHENPIFFNITESIGKFAVQQNFLVTRTLRFPFAFICTVIVIFIIGFLVERIRKFIFDKIIFNYLCNRSKISLIFRKLDFWFSS